MSSLDLVEYGNRLYESFLQKWQFDIENPKSKNLIAGNKLQFYANIKESFVFEPYLDILAKKERVKLTRLRASCHNLCIELGRHSRPYTPVGKRLCEECKEIEDEVPLLNIL